MQKVIKDYKNKLIKTLKDNSFNKIPDLVKRKKFLFVEMEEVPQMQCILLMI